MSNKTISINPALFSVSGSRTRKAREKKAPKALPVISPNLLKQKLLHRIKEHKQHEIKNLNSKEKDVNKKSMDDISFSDEFVNSINYLQTLSKQKQIDDNKQKRREEIERSTVKNYYAMNNSPSQQINIDLPDELAQPIIMPNPTAEPIRISNSTNGDVPYGILKGGIKPSYREWTKTQRNNIVTNPNASLIVNTPSSIRENRLNMLKEKIKNDAIKSDPINSENLIKHPLPPPPPVSSSLFKSHQPTSVTIQTPEVHMQTPSQIKTGGNNKIIATKHITKKTIKRKYTLGKSQIKKTVSVLIKDRSTRKRVLNAQKELKHKNINDVKSYLREHNLIKMGSNAPNDVLRKLYESAMLAGEITNSNKETLLHNFSKDDKGM